jgi:hypothetical protein
MLKSLSIFIEGSYHTTVCYLSNNLVIVELEVLLPGSDILGQTSIRFSKSQGWRLTCGAVYPGGGISDGIMRSRMVTCGDENPLMESEIIARRCISLSR